MGFRYEKVRRKRKERKKKKGNERTDRKERKERRGMNVGMVGEDGSMHGTADSIFQAAWEGVTWVLGIKKKKKKEKRKEDRALTILRIGP